MAGAGEDGADAVGAEVVVGEGVRAGVAGGVVVVLGLVADARVGGEFLVAAVVVGAWIVVGPGHGGRLCGVAGGDNRLIQGVKLSRFVDWCGWRIIFGRRLVLEEEVSVSWGGQRIYRRFRPSHRDHMAAACVECLLWTSSKLENLPMFSGSATKEFLRLCL